MIATCLMYLYLAGACWAFVAFSGVDHYRMTGHSRAFFRDLPWIFMLALLWPVILPILLFKTR